VDAADFESLGLYESAGENAELRLELLKYLAELGATAEELVEYRDVLPGLAMVLAVRGGPALSIEEAANRSGLSIHNLRRLVRAAGFADPEPGSRVLSEGFVDLASSLDAVADIFGEETVYQLVRVIGSSMSRIADAFVSAFLVNVEPRARRQDPVGLGVAKANVEAIGLLPLVPPLLDALLRQHLLTARRTVVAEDDPVGYETRQLVVGFIDLVGSTQLAQQLPIGELGAVLTAFEHIASDAITAAGDRVVKLIGDEIMYTATDARTACLVALELSEAFRQHPVVPSVRAALASGVVMLRDGDAFGPVVNLAARAVKVAYPDEVLATTEVVKAAGIPYRRRGHHRLKGINEEVELHSLSADSLGRIPQGSATYDDP
jgi:adenylate cyclase